MTEAVKIQMDDPSATVAVEWEMPEGAGFPAVAPDWQSSDPSVATVSPTGTGWTAELRGHSPGKATVSASWHLNEPALSQDNPGRLGRMVRAVIDVSVADNKNVLEADLKVHPGLKGAPPDGWAPPGAASAGATPAPAPPAATAGA